MEPTFDASTYVYLDWAATAPLREEAAQAMKPFNTPGTINLAVGANANSLHSPGRAAFAAMEKARHSLAQSIGARPNEIIFTSGATEADNAAIFGITSAAIEARRKIGICGFTPHIIVSSIEHAAVQSPVKRLQSFGFNVTYLEPNVEGIITTDQLRLALTEETILVSVIMGNAEIGSIQPIKDLAQMTHNVGALFHTDATQVLGKYPIDVNDLGVDAMSLSAHKVGGPKGTGALYLRSRTPFDVFILGGGQENSLRSGTQNVCGMVGFAAAVEAALREMDQETPREIALRDKLYRELSSIPRVTCTVAVPEGSTNYLPNLVHVLVEGMESETILLRLDAAGFGVSGGSACSAKSLEPSHVLMALGVSKDAARGAVRLSFGHLTSEADIDAFIEAFKKVIY